MDNEIKIAISLIKKIKLPSGFTCFDLLTTKMKEVIELIEGGGDLQQLRKIAREEVPNSVGNRLNLDEVQYALNNGAIEKANYAVYDLTWPWTQEVVERVANIVMDAAEFSQGAITPELDRVSGEINNMIQNH